MFIPTYIRTLIILFPVTLCLGKRTVRVYNSSRDKWYTGTKTPYELLTDLKVDESEIRYSGYRPIKLWYIGRHGPRRPEYKILKAMFSILPTIKAEVLEYGPGNPCYSEELKMWDPQSNLKLDGQKLWLEETTSTDGSLSEIAAHHTTKLDNQHNEIHLPSYTKSLTLQGMDTMTAMGERFRKRFGKIIPPGLDPKTEIIFTKTLRTKESAISFATGLFGEKPSESSLQIREVNKRDKVLKFDSVCSYWKLMVKRKPAMSKIFDDYERGDEMSNTLMQVKERCSLKNLDQKALMRIYATCAYELGWYDESPWCNFFLDHHLQVLEYDEDLKLYNRSAYGDEMNHRIACPLFNDMFDFFTKQNDVFFRFNFSHAKSLVKFSAHLHLFKTEEGLRADNYKDKDKREWASSKFAGFGFNFTFVLYESENNPNERAVLLMLNEQRIKIPRCNQDDVDTYLCPWEIFETIFEDSIHNCHYEDWCKIEEYGPLYEKYMHMKKKDKYDDATIFAALNINF